MTAGTHEGGGEAPLLVGMKLPSVQCEMEPSVSEAGVGGVEEVGGRERGKE